MLSSSWWYVKKGTVLANGVGLRGGTLITSSSKVEATVSSLLEMLSLKLEGPWSGTFSWLHLVRIGRRTMTNSTHCSVMSPSTLIAAIQEAEGGLILNLILQPFHCQEYYQNSALFSQFLLMLYYANHFILYLFISLTILDRQ